MLTPKKYWRIPRTLDAMKEPPPEEFDVPSALAAYKEPPQRGDGVLLADFEPRDSMGLVRHLGIIGHPDGRKLRVSWRSVEANIWVDTPAGIGNWRKADGFAFAATKVAGYGLHDLFARAFNGLDARQPLPAGTEVPRRRARHRGLVAPERLDPMEVVGQATGAARGGWVYVLKSALGYKVGRTRSVANRMLEFGVKLPILYTIPVVAWFDDHYEAETSYHRLFADRHINGEWFDLGDEDVDLIRNRQFTPDVA